LLTNDRFDYNPTMKLANWLALAALALAVLGILLFVEVIRPFHNLSIDGPLALLSWGSGAGLALVTLWLRGRSVIFSAVSLSLNLVLLVTALVILWLVSHSNFAWH
jgi:hypothetical protein